MVFFCFGFYLADVGVPVCVLLKLNSTINLRWGVFGSGSGWLGLGFSRRCG
jgi:hypothetical protein